MTFTPSQDLTQRAAEFPGGLIIRAQNPDGTEITASRMLGRNSVVNLNAPFQGQTIVDSNKKAILIVTASKADGARQPVRRVIPIDFSGAEDIENVTLAEQVTALSTAAPDLFTVTIDASTQRILVAANPQAGIKYLAFSGILAGTLGFGNGNAWRSFGCPFFDFYENDDVITATPTTTKSEDQDITLAGGSKGLTRTITITGKPTGYSIALASRTIRDLFDQAVTGKALSFGESAEGSLDEFPALPNEVISDNGAGRLFTVYYLTLRYVQDIKGNRDNFDAILVRKFRDCSIAAADDGTGALTQTTRNYTISAPVSVMDSQGNEIVNGVESPFFMGDDKMNNLNALLDIVSLDAKLKVTSLNVVKISTATPTQSSITLVPVQVGRNAYSFEDASGNPIANPQGIVVTFEPLTTLTNTTLVWDYENDRVEIHAGSITGTETVTVQFTNVDGTIVNSTFALTVA